MTVSAPAVPRVLVLHGHFQNASVFRKRMAPLIAQAGSSIEFVFVDAPHILQPADTADSARGPSDPQSAEPLRAWWNADIAKGEAVGLEESLVTLRDFLRGQRFDGVFGFSQGAALAALLAALLERPHLHAPFLVDGAAPHPPFKFCVSISGFPAPGALSRSVYAQGYATPTLHVFATHDVVVVEERSRALIPLNRAADGTPRGTVAMHTGGHFIPGKPRWKQFLVAYMLDPTGDIPVPGVVGGEQ